jgi:alkanesulfonate monooxygenase SsuD/methylene tetrahydromethanopterin reductase-like flavin-dependent oxidoreductase (luciferase family)
LHVGYGAAFQQIDDEPDELFFRRELELCLLAESLGMDSVWLPEHHFSSYGLMPDPLQALAYIAARTTHVKLGTGVVVLPWHDPVLVAEQFIQLDHLSEGRVIVGIGRGLAKGEFEGLRVEQDESRARFNEYAELLLQALETGFVEGGELTRQPRRELRPRPFRSFRGRVFSASVSPESAPLMARLGVGLAFANLKPAEAMRGELERYREAWAEEQGGEPPQPFLQATVFVDESADRALELANRYGEASYHVSLSHYAIADADFGTAKGYEYYREFRVEPGTEFAQAPDHYAKKAIYGTPDQVLERFDELKRALDMQGVFVLFHGTPGEDGERNLRTFVQHCLPELRSWPAVSSFEEVALA